MHFLNTRASDSERAADVEHAPFADAVRFYLQMTPRQLPSRFLYDSLGSSLFEAICNLPWYGITRAELRLVERHGAAIGRALGSRARIAELGSGNGDKLAALLTSARIPRVHAHLIDLSRAALARSERTLAAIDGVDLTVALHHATYEDGVLALPAIDTESTLIAFLGSNIGNFDMPGAAALLQLIRGALRPGDYLLLGADLVKPERDLLLAYDDPLGVTAAFNKNLLVRINTELGGDFAIERFAHRAVWNASASRVEMHLVSLAPQQVRIARSDLEFSLERGETIWTESSYKYEPDALAGLVEGVRFTNRELWIDASDRFALALFEAT